MQKIREMDHVAAASVIGDAAKIKGAVFAPFLFHADFAD